MTVHFDADVLNHQGILEMPACTLAQTQEIAQTLARRLQKRLLQHPNFVLELAGPLGAGKTTFARFLLQALGVEGRIKSPTYAIVECYEVLLPTFPKPLPLFHFDFYRFQDAGEWEAAGFRDLFAAPGLKLIEWADKARGFLPPADMQLQLAFGEHEGERILHLCSREEGMR